MLTSEPPPSYSEVTSSGYGSSSGVSGSHLLVVTAQEVDEVLRRHTPHLNLTTTQKDTVKRKTESLLKRNLREHGILPSSQQKQFILERVVLEFVPQSNNPRLTSSSGHDIPRGSSSNSARTPVMTQPAPSVVHVTTPPSGGHMDNQRQLVVIGKWWWNSNVYSHEVQRVVNGMMIIAILLCVIGTPLTLFFTIPTLYILRKVRKCVYFHKQKPHLNRSCARDFLPTS